MTNREKLRELPDEKLARLIARKSIRRCDFCFFDDNDCPNPYTGSYCIDGISKWLKFESASEGGGSHEK